MGEEKKVKVSELYDIDFAEMEARYAALLQSSTPNPDINTGRIKRQPVDEIDTDIYCSPEFP
jgi:hypothetical protein